jgi:hypothetical protein
VSPVYALRAACCGRVGMEVNVQAGGSTVLTAPAMSTPPTIFPPPPCS